MHRSCPRRLGTRLRDLRKSYKNSSSPLSGKGKLTDKVINSLQNYYGLAIRQNIGNLHKMKVAIGAILFHCTYYEDDQKRHMYCPRDATSWCKYQRNQLAGKSESKTSINLPMWINKLVYPIFKDLSSDDLLSKCLHGKTQNSNEALNNLIWRKCPKGDFVDRATLECAVNSAVIQFNDGPNAISDVFHHFGIAPGVILQKSSNKKVSQRMKNIEKKMS